MPAAIAIPLITAGVTAGATAGASIYGAHKQAGAAKQAGNLEAQASQQQLKFLQQQEAARQAEFAKTQALNLDQYNQKEARLAPFRQTGTQAVTNLGQLMRPGSGSSYLPPPRMSARTMLKG